MAAVELLNVAKSYDGKVPIIHGIDLDIQDGEFVVFVGPSGCGKSTLLRMIAGLESISSGELRIAGERVTRPHRLPLAGAEACENADAARGKNPGAARKPARGRDRADGRRGTAQQGRRVVPPRTADRRRGRRQRQPAVRFVSAFPQPNTLVITAHGRPGTPSPTPPPHRVSPGSMPSTRTWNLPCRTYVCSTP